MASCHQEKQPDGIRFADVQLQQVWERARTSVLSAKTVKQEELPAVLPVWLALGYRQEAQTEIEHLANRIDSLQPSATLSKMAYDVSVFADDEEWNQQYAIPIIRKCAEYYKRENKNSDEARYCFERMVLYGLDDLGEYARILSDSSMSYSYAPSKQSDRSKEWLHRINTKSVKLTDEALTIQSIIHNIVCDSRGELEIAKDYPWNTDTHFKNIYSSLGVKVSGSIVSKQVEITMEAWRDTDFILMGEHIRLAREQKTERSFQL